MSSLYSNSELTIWRQTLLYLRKLEQITRFVWSTTHFDGEALKTNIMIQCKFVADVIFHKVFGVGATKYIVVGMG